MDPQKVNRRVFEDETGTLTHELPSHSARFLCVEVVTLASGSVTVTGGVVGETTLMMTNAETAAQEAAATAPGLWYVFVTPYSKLTVKGATIPAGNEIWIGMQ